MNLHSGLPYWLVLNGLATDYPQLAESISEEIVIIGSGISGALVANELCKAGFSCIMLDRRMISTGSTVASTAHLNYEIDISLKELIKRYGESFAIDVYQSNLNAVKRVGEVLSECGVNADYESKGSLYLASDRNGEREVEEECQLRNKNNFSVELIDKSVLMNEYGINRKAGLRHSKAAQFDAYAASTGLINHWSKSGQLRVYPRTEIKDFECETDYVKLKTSTGLIIKAKHVVCAPGYESELFLPKKVMKIKSTYAVCSQPLSKETLWKDQPLIWETARPYFYVRGTKEGRVMMGGLDETFKNDKLRDLLLEKKTINLVENCIELFPNIKKLM